MTKILIATGLYPPEIGGPATYTRLAEMHLPMHGFSVSVLPFSRVRHLPKIVRHIAFFVQCLRMGRTVDVIFAQDPVSVGLPSMLAAKLLRKKFFIRMPGDYAWEQSVQRFGVTETIDAFQSRTYGIRVEFLRKIQRFVTRSADRIITPSDYFNRLVSGWGVPEDRVRTVYNGIDLRVNPREPVSVPSGRVIVSAGRLVPWKGFDLLIKILPSLSSDWSLVILGEGPEDARLKRLAEDQGVAERVIFTGSVSREEVFGWCHVATAFALNTSFESFSFQIVEAMAAGIPIVTTRIGSIPELITDGREGRLLEPNDREGFARELLDVAQNPDVWRERTARAKEKASTFTIEETMRKLAAVLHESI